MSDALYISATGMDAQQKKLDAIANNLANMATPGFRKTRVQFTELIARDLSRMAAPSPELSLENLGPAPTLTSRGLGVAIAGMNPSFEQGDIKKTDQAMDLAINGDGLLEVALPDGTRAYTRGGTLSVTRDGLLATAAGQPFRGNLYVGTAAQTIVIDSQGKVFTKLDDRSPLNEIGQLELVRFHHPEGLSALGSGLFKATEQSGEAMPGRAGENGMGSLAQGSLEQSNVKMTEELIALTIAQRAFELSAKVIQAADEMTGLANNLRR